MIHHPRLLTVPSKLLQRLGLLLSLAACSLFSAAAAEANHRFDIPAGDAVVTLKQAAQQGATEIMYPTEVVRGIQTRAISGSMATPDALSQMLAGTGLSVVLDTQTNALAVRRLEPSQVSRQNVPDRQADVSTATIAAKSSTGSAQMKDGAVVLSPFEVNTEKDEGYHAENSLSGTRLNTKLEDLAASVSVVTKQQLNDTAAIDINDIFNYESNTEGTHQYTDFTIDRSFYNENTTLNPQSSNRIRGIGSANMAVNNFAQSSSIPVDTYNVESVEISRGPNANIYGLGNASGTVNLNTGHANLTKDRTEFQTRGDSLGGWRGSTDLNRVLLKDRLAVKIAAVHDDKGFVRKPAYERINRLTLAFAARPFKSTTIRGSYESYNNHFDRANTTLPRDSITEWKNSGMPVWNPAVNATSGGYRYLNNPTYTPVLAANEATQFPLGLIPASVTGSGFVSNPSVFIDGNGQVLFYGMNAPSATTTSPTVASTTPFHYVETGNIYRRASDINVTPNTPLLLYQAPSLRDKSIYDWTKTNILAPNFGRDKADVYEATLEQSILNTPRHKVFAEMGYHREVIDRLDHSIFSRSDSAIPYIEVDVNEFLIDGTKNPYFLRPYMGGSQPAIKRTDERNGDWRGQLAYQLDLTGDSGWTKWLGHHNFGGYAERRDLLVTSLTSRDLNVNNYSWSSANDLGSIPLRGNNYRLFPRYYLGGPVTDPGPVVDYAPAGNFALGNTPFTWYTSARTPVNEAASIQEVIQSGSSTDRVIRTQGATWQGYFWHDRIVTLIGVRNDVTRQRNSRNLNSNLNATTTIDPNTHLHDQSWVQNFPGAWEGKHGASQNYAIVFKATRWLNFNFNQANSFKPETLAYGIETNLLPNPTGKTKDYGVTIKLFDEKLTGRISRYESIEKNSRNGSITSAAVTRTLRLFFDPSSSNALVTFSSPGQFSSGSDSFDLEQSAAQWYAQQNPGATAAQAQQAAVTNYLQPLGIDQGFIDRVRQIGSSAFTDVNTVTSNGIEVEFTYNPTRYWTMKLAGAQQKAVDTDLGDAVNNFINSRLAAAQSIVVPSTPVTVANGTAGKFWWQSNPTSPVGTGTSYPAGFSVVNVKSVIDLATANAGKPRQQTREYRANFTTNYRLAGMFDQGWLKSFSVGGSARWESKAAQGYYGAAPSTDPAYAGAVVDYDPNRPIYDKPRYYFDAWISDNVKLFGRTNCKIQLNVKDVFENGRLQPISYNPDGVAWNYRIIDPRQFILTATFDL